MRVVDLNDPYSWRLAPNERICLDENCANVDKIANMTTPSAGVYYCRFHTGSNTIDITKGTPNDPDA